MAKRNSKVIRYKRPVNFNIGMIVFLVFFLYLAVYVVNYITQDKTQIYEVGEASSVVKDNMYTGLILRDESVHTTPDAGYINFYIREGARASVGDTVYSIDENGQYTQLLSSGSTGESSLSSEQLSTLKKKLSAYTASYRQEDFKDIYDVKYTLQNLLLGYLASSSLDDLKSLGIDTTYLKTAAADVSGVVEYYTDGFEEKTEEQLTLKDMDEDEYKRTTLTSGSLVEKDAPVYKTVTSETWAIYLPLTEEDRNLLADQTSVTLQLNDINLEVTAGFSLVTISDGTILGKCTMSRYMVQLADKRYASVTLKKSAISSLNITGLKIPKSAVISKDFYVVPLDYGAVGGNSSELGFYKEVYSAEGTTAEFISPTISAKTDEYYCLDLSEIEGGVVLRKPSEGEASSPPATSAADETTAEPESGETAKSEGSGNTYTLGSTTSLQGVYSVNKGYAVFKQIEILDENEDYYIVAEGQSYGLSIYDHILLNGQSYSEGDLVY